MSRFAYSFWSSINKCQIQWECLWYLECLVRSDFALYLNDPTVVKHPATHPGQSLSSHIPAAMLCPHPEHTCSRSSLVASSENFQICSNFEKTYTLTTLILLLTFYCMYFILFKYSFFYSSQHHISDAFKSKLQTHLHVLLKISTHI